MKKIFIVGGGFHNKGAQSMTFIAVDEMRKRFPNHEIYVICDSEYERAKKHEEMYNFKIKQFDSIIPVLKRKSPKQFLYYLLKGDKVNEKRVNDFYSQVDIMLDISGYALGSDWPECEVENYLYRIDCARYFRTKVYVMPQSFGPFEYEAKEKKKMFSRIKKALSYAKTVCAREQEGYDTLTQDMGLDNVIKTYDLVLNNKSVDLNNIYKNVPDFDIPQIKPNSIAIIPNAMTVKHGDKDKILSLYKELMSVVLKTGKDIYILHHSNMDKDFCKEIFEIISSDKIHLLEQEFNCVEFNSLVSQFDFIVASRFHAVVHAYKNFVPCVTLGWAVKYRELHNAVAQDKYVFNIRNNFDNKSVLDALGAMLQNYEKESSAIKDKMSEIQKDNIFDIIKLE